MVYPLVKRWSNATRGIVSTSYKNSRLGSYRLDEIDQSNSMKSKSRSSHMRSDTNKNRVVHQSSIPNDTAWGSDEAIVTLDNDDVRMRAGQKSTELRPESHVAKSFAVDRRSQTGPKGGAGLVRGDILMTREWQLSEEREPVGEKN